MARREVKIQKYTKIGLAVSAVACLAALGALTVMLMKWDPEDGVIDAGHRSKPVIMLGIAAAIACGFPGFLLSLEGAAGLEGLWRKLGWLGFALGAVAAMAGLLLGLWFWFYKF